MFDISKCYNSFATEPNSAYFWSGLGIYGEDIAEKIARANDGATLEMIMEQNKDAIVSAGFPYDEDLGGFYWSKDTALDWEVASQAFAEQASGEAHVILGDNVRGDGVWNTKEFPALSENDNVRLVTSVDPVTGRDNGVLLDKGSGVASTSEQDAQISISSSNIASVGGGGARAPDDGNAIAGQPPTEPPLAPQNNPQEIAGQPPTNPPTYESSEPIIAGTTPDKKQDLDMSSLGENAGKTGMDLAEDVGKQAAGGIDTGAGIT